MWRSLRSQSQKYESVSVCVCVWLAGCTFTIHTIWAVSLGSVLWFNYSCTEGCKAPGLSTVRGYFYCNTHTLTHTHAQTHTLLLNLLVSRGPCYTDGYMGKKCYLRSHENDTHVGLSHCTAESWMFESRSSKRFAGHTKLMGRMTEDSQGISWT